MKRVQCEEDKTVQTIIMQVISVYVVYEYYPYYVMCRHEDRLEPNKDDRFTLKYRLSLMTEYININEAGMKRLWVQDLDLDVVCEMWNTCDLEGKRGN